MFFTSLAVTDKLLTMLIHNASEKLGEIRPLKQGKVFWLYTTIFKYKLTGVIALASFS